MLLPMLFLPKESYNMEGFWQYLYITICIVTLKMGYREGLIILYTC